VTLQLEGKGFAMQSHIRDADDGILRVEFDDLSKERESFQKFLLALIDAQLEGDENAANSLEGPETASQPQAA